MGHGVFILLLVVCATGLGESSEPSAVVQAHKLARSGQIQKAEQVLRDAVAAAPDSSEIRCELGTFYLGLKRYEEAVDELGRAANLRPEVPKYSMLLAEALISWQHFQTAIDFLSAVKPKFEGLPEYHYNLGMAYYWATNFPAARSEFQRATQLSPKLDAAHYFLANCHANLGDLEKAAASYRQAVALNPKPAVYCFALGRVLTKMGGAHEAEGVTWLEKSLALDPASTAAKFDLALAYMKRGDLNTARPLMEEVASRHPEAVQPHAALAQIYFRLKQPDKAERERALAQKLQSVQKEKQSRSPSAIFESLP